LYESEYPRKRKRKKGQWLGLGKNLRRTRRGGGQKRGLAVEAVNRWQKTNGPCRDLIDQMKEKEKTKNVSLRLSWGRKEVKGPRGGKVQLGGGLKL